MAVRILLLTVLGRPELCSGCETDHKDAASQQWRLSLQSSRADLQLKVAAVAPSALLAVDSRVRWTCPSTRMHHHEGCRSDLSVLKNHPGSESQLDAIIIISGVSWQDKLLTNSKILPVPEKKFWQKTVKWNICLLSFMWKLHGCEYYFKDTNLPNNGNMKPDLKLILKTWSIQEWTSDRSEGFHSR